MSVHYTIPNLLTELFIIHSADSRAITSLNRETLIFIAEMDVLKTQKEKVENKPFFCRILTTLL